MMLANESDKPKF